MSASFVIASDGKPYSTRKLHHIADGITSKRESVSIFMRDLNKVIVGELTLSSAAKFMKTVKRRIFERRSCSIPMVLFLVVNFPSRRSFVILRKCELLNLRHGKSWRLLTLLNTNALPLQWPFRENNVFAVLLVFGFINDGGIVEKSPFMPTYFMETKSLFANKLLIARY